jgi:hypothetical protein
MSTHAITWSRNPLSYTFTELRKKLGIAGTFRRNSEDDNTWKEFRRLVRREIVKACIRCIKKNLKSLADDTVNSFCR